MITVKTAEQIAAMRRAGRVVAEIHERCREAARPGVTTAALADAAAEVLARRNAVSSFLGYHGFPSVICTSPNDVVVHGIPGDRVLEDGDIVGIDAGAIIDGWHGDAAVTVPVGEVRPDVRHLLDATETALIEGIRQTAAGNRLGDVGAAVQDTAEAAGLGIVRDYVGHGIGRAMHEDPEVHNVGPAGSGRRIRLGWCLAIEPMCTLGTPTVKVLDDHWTVVTVDGAWSAHFEHTVAVTDDGPEILTLP